MVSNCQQMLIFGWTFLLRKHSVSLSLGPEPGVKQNFAQPLCRCPNKKVEILYYCVHTLTFTFLTVVCLIKWVDLAHFCQVPFICQSSLKDVSSLTCSWVLHRFPITWCHPWRRHVLLQQSCVNSLLKCLPGQRFLGVYSSSISTQIQVRCIDAASLMLAGWRTQPLWSSCLFKQEGFNRDKICDKRSDGLWMGIFVWRRAGMQRVNGDLCVELKRWCIFCLADLCFCFLPVLVLSLKLGRVFFRIVKLWSQTKGVIMFLCII